MVVRKKKDSEKKERYEVLYEDLNSQMRLIAEGVMGLGGKMDKMDFRFDELQGEILEFKGEVGAHFHFMDRTINSLKDEVKINRKWIIQNQKAVERIEDKLDKHGSVIMEHEKKLAVG